MAVRSIMEIQQATRGARRGTIRGGEFVNGKPVKRETWLLTSPDDAVLRAMPFKGDILPYSAQGERSNDRWQLDTGTDVLRVRLSAYGSPISQRYELYGKGGLTRDCDGVNVKTVDATTGEMIEQPCMCAENARDCKLATRLSVILTDAATFGSWLLTTGSENAAYELIFAVNMLMEAERIGATVPAILRLEQRTIKKQGEKYPRRFAVPVLDADPLAMTSLMSGEQGVASLGTGDPDHQADAPVAALGSGQAQDSPAVEGRPGESTRTTTVPTSAESGTRPTITQNQIAGIMVAAKEQGLSEAEVKAIVLQVAGVRSRKDIAVSDYPKVMAAITGELTQSQEVRRDV